MSPNLSRAGLLMALALVPAACDNPIEVTTGSMHVLVTTTGGDLDRDGYRLVVDSGGGTTLSVNGNLSLADLAAGPHIVELRDVAANCTVSGQNPQTITVVPRTATDVALAVACVRTGVTVTMGTSGLDQDADGYQLLVDSGPAMPIGINNSATVTYLTPGGHTLALSGLAANCVPDTANPSNLTIALGQVVLAKLVVHCFAVTGVLEVDATTSGIDRDADGYAVVVDSGAPRPIAPTGTLSSVPLSGGSHAIDLTGVAANCTVAGGSQRVATVTTGGLTRDTVRISFAATCTAATGVVAVLTPTTGLDTDSNGYTVTMDNAPPAQMSAGGQLFIPGVSGGNHSITLGGVAANCAVGGGNARIVPVATGGTTRDTVVVTFDVGCVAATGSIAVVATTTGADIDADGYRVWVDGDSARFMPANGTVVFTGRSAGSHLVSVAGLAPNCTLSGASVQTVSVTTGGLVRDTANAPYAINCVAVSGSLAFNMTTTGSDPDPDGYSVLVNGFFYTGYTHIDANGSATVAHLPAGPYLLAFVDVASNCDTVSPVPSTASVAIGAVTNVTLSVSCRLASELAFVADSDIYRGKENGQSSIALTSAGQAVHPAWSPDGSALAFSSTRDGQPEIYRMNADGSGVRRLTVHPAIDEQPAWSPDGARLAFSSRRDGNAEIYAMNADGTSIVRLTSNVGDDTEPAWSPDGLRIAFISTRGGTANLWIMNADGTNVARLSQSFSTESHPVWSPDGTLLVVSRVTGCFWSGCNANLVVMNADGSGPRTLVVGGVIGNPAWSPDGHWIAYDDTSCDYYYYYSGYGCYANVKLVTVDGQRVAYLKSPLSASQPTWRP